MMLPALRSQINWSAGSARALGKKAFRRGSRQVSATTGNSSTKSPGCRPASASPATARWFASTMASNRRINRLAGFLRPPADVRRHSISRQRIFSFGMADEKVEERAKKMQQHNHQNPGDFLAVAQTLVLQGLDQHPDPESHQRQANRQQQQDGQKNQKKFHTAQHINRLWSKVRLCSSLSSAPAPAPAIFQTSRRSGSPGLAATG